MATMKDVARLAGVSHGTVSNVINGVVTVNSETAARVERAMRELGYQPDAKARSLRRNRTGMIGFLLPNSTDGVYAQLYRGAAEPLQEAGYTLSLVLTGDCPETEARALRQLQQQRAEAVLLVSCMPERTELFDSLAAQGIRLVFLQRRPGAACRGDFFGLEYEECYRQAAAEALREGRRDLCLLTGSRAFSCEEAAAAGFRRALEEAGVPWREDRVRCADGSREDAFRAAVWWLQGGEVPRVIFTTCTEHGAGATAAVRMFPGGAGAATEVASPEGESWIWSAADRTMVSQPLERLGAIAAENLLGRLSGKEMEQNRTLLLPVPVQSAWRPFQTPSGKGPLRLALLQGAASYAVQFMLPRFTARTGVRAEAELFSYEELRALAEEPECGSGWDLIQVSAAWAERPAARGAFAPLEGVCAACLSEFPEELLERYGLRDREGGAARGMPYMLDAQLLFYRKDLFEEARNRRFFYERFHRELRVPGTWEELEQIAGFFTREKNPESPTRYGVTMGGCPSYAVYGFMPCLWERGGALFARDGTLLGGQPEALEALRLYAGLFSSACPEAPEWGWTEQTIQFVEGDAAMMPLYQAHYRDFLSRESGAVTGKLGIAPLPGNRSVQGGWSLSVPAGSPRREEAALLLSWIAAPENAVPCNVLGGSLPTKAVLGSLELKKAYPWFFMALEGLRSSAPMLPDNAPIGQPGLESLLGQALHRMACGLLTPEEALEVLSLSNH